MAFISSPPSQLASLRLLVLAFRGFFGNISKSLRWAWLDTVCQYRRSRIGPLWETINVLVMLIGLTVVASSILGTSMIDIVGYIGVGIIIWTAISSLVIEGSGVFIRNAGYVTNSTLGVDLYIGRTIFKIMIISGHHIILYFVGLLFGLIAFSWICLLAIPGVVLLFANGFWIVMVLGLICARYRDVEVIVRNLMQLAFFVTPVFWDYHHIASDRQFIVEYNVLFYLIEIIRDPLLGRVPPAAHYLTIIAVTVFGYGLGYIVYRKMRPQLAFCV
jgi:homopolymeric O-antigen transport system permease protein